MPFGKREVFMRLKLVYGVGLAVVFAAAQPVMAAQAATFPDGPVHLRYAVYVHGFHVVDVHADYALSQDGYDVRTSLQTDGIWAMLLKMKIESDGQGRFDGSAVRPEFFKSNGYSRGKERTLDIRYEGISPVVKDLTPPETDRVPVEVNDRANAIDTVGAMMLLLGTLDRTEKCDGGVKIFDGLRLIDMNSTSAGNQALPDDSRLSYTGSAIRCDFVGQQVAGFMRFSHHEAQMRKPQPGSVWFQNIPGYGLVAVRIELNHPKLGHLTVLLDGAPSHA